MAVFSSVLLPLENWMFLPDRPSVCQATARELAGSIRAYRKERPNVFIVVTLHWGAEYHSLPTSLQRRQAEQIVAAGADMIVGHHPHVVQSIAWVHDRPVLFSLGNFVFDQRRSDSSRGMLVEVWLSTRGEPQFYLRPYRIDGCVPVPMSPSEAREFKQFVLSLSDGVVLDDTTDGWRLLRR